MEHAMSHGFTYNHTLDIFSYHPGFLIDLDISTRWRSGPMISMQVWRWYITVAGVLYGMCTMSNSWVTSHEPQLHLKPNPRHAQLVLSCFFSWIFRTTHSRGDTVNQSWSCRSGYTIPLFQECWVRHGSYLIVIGVKHTTSHGFTCNHTPAMLIYHPGFMIVPVENSISTMW